MREKLQNKVTKAKEQLENYLAKSNCEIRLSEKIIKGIQKFVNKEKNTIRNNFKTICPPIKKFL